MLVCVLILLFGALFPLVVRVGLFVLFVCVCLCVLCVFVWLFFCWLFLFHARVCVCGGWCGCGFV